MNEIIWTNIHKIRISCGVCKSYTILSCHVTQCNRRTAYQHSLGVCQKYMHIWDWEEIKYYRVSSFILVSLKWTSKFAVSNMHICMGLAFYYTRSCCPEASGKNKYTKCLMSCVYHFSVVIYLFIRPAVIYLVPTIFHLMKHRNWKDLMRMLPRSKLTGYLSII